MMLALLRTVLNFACWVERSVAVTAAFFAVLLLGSSPSSAQFQQISPVIQLELESNTWRLISLPVAPPPDQSSVEAVFGDDIPATYGTDWSMYRFDEPTSRYVNVGLNGELIGGQAYWIMQNTGFPVTLEMPHGSSPVSVLQSPACEVNQSDGPQAGCFRRVAGGARWNAVGNPFYGKTSLDDLRVKTETGNCSSDTGCTLAIASEQGVLSTEFWGFDGVQYQRVSGGGVLEPWTGYWNTLLPSGGELSPVLLLPRTVAADAVRAVVDQKDINGDAYQIHVIYAIPANGRDELLDATGVIHGSVRQINNTFFRMAHDSDIDRQEDHRLRIDEKQESTIVGFPPYDISFNILPRNGEDYQSAQGASLLEDDLISAGFRDERKLYLVYYMGSSSAYGCVKSGDGRSPFAILFLQSPSCQSSTCETCSFTAPFSNHFSWHVFSPPGGWERLALYSILNTLGFPQSCALNYQSDGRFAVVNDDLEDVLFQGGVWPDLSQLDSPYDIAMDSSQDDYYSPTGLPASCSANLYNSAFLTPDEFSSDPPPQGMELPVGWSERFD